MIIQELPYHAFWDQVEAMCPWVNFTLAQKMVIYEDLFELYGGKDNPNFILRPYEFIRNYAFYETLRDLIREYDFLQEYEQNMPAGLISDDDLKILFEDHDLTILFPEDGFHYIVKKDH